MTTSRYVIGIDGGGSKTVAWLADEHGGKDPVPDGRGESGASNPQSVGWEVAQRNLDSAVDAAFASASLSPAPVASACVAVGGCDRDSEHRVLQKWASDRRLAEKTRIVNDALPVLAAISPNVVGVALICGTGSMAYGRNASGTCARAGGWGHLMGDEGSAYAIALAGLKAVGRSLDGRSPKTIVTDLLSKRLDLATTSELVPSIYRHGADRSWIASLAPMVSTAASRGDAVATRILDDAAAELAEMIVVVAERLELHIAPFALGMAGGVLRNCIPLRQQVLQRLVDAKLTPSPVQTVDEPVVGAVKLARSAIERE